MGVQDEIKKAKYKTVNNNGLVMNIALNYGARNEMTRAINRIIETYGEESLSKLTIDEQLIETCLDTAGLPDPDLLIRTSGEKRISNFLLWQIAYTELFFTDVLWPDFRGENLVEAIIDFQSRQRRFGGLS